MLGARMQYKYTIVFPQGGNSQGPQVAWPASHTALLAAGKDHKRVYEEGADILEAASTGLGRGR